MTNDIRPPAVILAGGLSRRMGTDKADLKLGGVPLALLIADRLRPQVSDVLLNAPEGHPLANTLSNIPDRVPDRPGPLAGVLTGMKAIAELPIQHSHVLTTPCDTPFLPHDLVLRLTDDLQSGTIVMAACAGRSHPVTALWPVSLADDLETWLFDPNHRRVFDFIARHPSKTIEFEPLHGPFGSVDPFFNVNTPEDLTLAEAILERGEA